MFRAKTKDHHRNFERLLEEMGELYNKKRDRYADDEDPLRNFKKTAELCEQLLSNPIPKRFHPLAVAMILNAKHIVAGYEMVSLGKEDTIESVETSFMDTAIYSVLQIQLREGAVGL
jgi:hypothetical protein